MKNAIDIKSLFSLLLILFLCSCGSKKNDFPDDILHINLFSDNGPAITKLTEIAERIDYIALETKDSSLLGEFKRKVILRDNRIYIQCENDIVCFDRTGKFLLRISKKGRGAEEYSHIEDFDVSQDNKEVLILSRNRLITYSIANSEINFRGSITLSEPFPYRLKIVPGTEYVFMAIPPWRGDEQTLSLLLKSDGRIVNYKPNCYKYDLVRKNNFRASNEMIVYSFNDLACFKEEFSDTVFYVDVKENNFKPRIILDSDGTLTTPSIRGGGDVSKGITTLIAKIFETKRYLFYYFITSDMERHRFLFDKTTNSKHKLDTEAGLIDDLMGGPSFKIEFINDFTDSDYLISFIETLAFKNYVTSAEFIETDIGESKKKGLLKITDALNETDNPVLIIVTPRK